MRDHETCTHENADYEIGHCKPPKAHQWQKGRSGNPAGKKRGVKSIGAVFRKVGNKVVRLKDGKTATLMELLMAAPSKHGAKGNTSNAIHAVSIAEQFGMAPADAGDEPKFGTIYRDFEGNAKVDYRYYPDRVEKLWKKLNELLAEFGTDDEGAAQPPGKVDPEKRS